MRALYFDMGIYGILRRTDMPPIQYSMTRDTHIGPDRRENPGRILLESLSDHINAGRISLYRFTSNDWPDRELSEWTFIPSRHNLSHATSGIWSERRSRKIAAGKEAKLWQVLLGNAVGSVNWTEQAVLATLGLPLGIAANLTPDLIPIICTLSGFLVAPSYASYASYASLRQRLKTIELIEGIPSRVDRDVRIEREYTSFLRASS